MLQCVVFERQPNWSVKGLHLRSDVRDVHRILVSALGDRWSSPARIFPPGHVAAAELRRAPIALLHDLLRFGNARIPFPRDPCALPRQIAVDVTRAQKTHAAIATHN